MNTARHSRNQTKVLRVFRACAVKVQPRIHREAAKSVKSAKISRRKILSCQQMIFGLVSSCTPSGPRKGEPDAVHCLSNASYNTRDPICDTAPGGWLAPGHYQSRRPRPLRTEVPKCGSMSPRAGG